MTNGLVLLKVLSEIMKKILPVLLLVFVLTVFPVSSVLAEDNAAGTMVDDKRPTTAIYDSKPLNNLPSVAPKVAALKSLAEKKASTQAAALRAKLLRFKDKNKADMLLKINDNLAAINENRTARMDQNLDKMSEILAKIQARVNLATASGKLGNSSQTSIDAAVLSIGSAKKAVLTQSEKDYTIKVASEAGVRSDAILAKQTLMRDLTATQQIVVTAKKSLMDAILAIISGLEGVK